MKRRVVVTGLGLVSPLGCNVQTAWTKLLNGDHGMVKLEGAEYKSLPCRVAALVPKNSFNTDEFLSKGDARTMSAATVYGVVAGCQALTDSNWFPSSKTEKQRTGVCVGMGMVDLSTICETAGSLEQNYKKVSPFFVPKILLNMAAGHLSIKFGFQGPNHSVSTACATGCHAIGDGFKFIQNDFADVMICGGTEACICPLAIAGFSRLRALSSTFNDSPGEASRPFDSKRDGFVMGEGSAILVLEELEHARKRNAKIYAEVLGYGLSGDASHITAPHESGEGAILAMTRALQDAKKEASDVHYINAHATSTPLGDAIELNAIQSLFQDHASNLAISSTKGSHGHLLGAAGNLETLFTVLACHTSDIPPTINLQNKCDEGKNLNLVPHKTQRWTSPQNIALKNSFGFGGTNASLCIGKFQ